MSQFKVILLFFLSVLSIGLFSRSVFATDLPVYPSADTYIDFCTSSKSIIDENFIIFCINASTTINEIPKKHWQKIKVVVVHDALDLSLDVQELAAVFPANNFVLVVDGVCAGKCSRILLPYASSVSFSQNSFAALTDSAIYSRIGFLAKNITITQQPSGILSFDAKKFADISSQYPSNASQKLSGEVEILSKTNTNFTHLLWYNFTKQRLRYLNIQRSCFPIQNMAIILTPLYLKRNLILSNPEYELPSNTFIVKAVKEKFGTQSNILIAETYEPYPLNCFKGSNSVVQKLQ